MSATINSVDVLGVRETIEEAGVAGLPGSFPPAWADDLREDVEQVFAEARSYPGGTISRGTNRYYFAVHPERLRRFADIATHPVLAALCAEMLGEDYQIIEVGVDLPLPGALDQPWHRDFAMPAESRTEGRLTSLAFNVTAVDVTEDMGPFEIVPGTHRDLGEDFDHGMFPAPEVAAQRYSPRGERRQPRRGDMSVRTGLTVHRGTANHSPHSRAVLIIGAVTAELAREDDSVHEIVVTSGYHASLPPTLRDHLRCTVVDHLAPIVQRHDIEGLVMGV